MEDKRSYFAILPANVRYNNKLTANAKLLYAEITALCNQKGYCWASNKYFSDLYEKDSRSIRRYLNNLVKEGYIHVEINEEKGNQRRIFLTNLIEKTHEKCPEGSGQKCPEVRTDLSIGQDKSVHHNNINKYNKLNESKNPSDAAKMPHIPFENTKSKKPCDKYNYIISEDKNYHLKLEQTKRSFVAMLEREYGVKVHSVYKDNLVNSEKYKKFFIALTTFLIEWEKCNKNRIKTYKDLIKTYLRRVFYNPDIEGTEYHYFKENQPKPSQLVTENSIMIWEDFWKKNSFLKVKTKTISLEVQKRQVFEREKYGWDLEKLHNYLWDNGRKLVLSENSEDKLKFRELKKLKQVLSEERDVWEKQKQLQNTP